MPCRAEDDVTFAAILLRSLKVRRGTADDGADPGGTLMRSTRGQSVSSPHLIVATWCASQACRSPHVVARRCCDAQTLRASFCSSTSRGSSSTSSITRACSLSKTSVLRWVTCTDAIDTVRLLLHGRLLRSVGVLLGSTLRGAHHNFARLFGWEFTNRGGDIDGQRGSAGTGTSS